MAKDDKPVPAWLEQELAKLSTKDIDLSQFKKALRHLPELTAARTPQKLQGHLPPSAAPVTSLDAILVDQLREGDRHVGKVLLLELLPDPKGDGLVRKAFDSKGTRCELWLLMLHPALIDRAGLAGSEAGLRIAVKEPYYTPDPSGKLFIRLDHPTDVELVPSVESSMKTMDLNAKDVTKFLKAGNVALIKENLPLAVECYSRGIGHCRGETAAKEIGEGAIELLSKRAFVYGRMGNFAKGEADVQMVLDIDGSDRQALRQSITFLMERGSYHQALARSQSLLRLHRDPQDLKLCDRVYDGHAQYTTGNYDFAHMLQMSDAAKSSNDIATFCGKIEKRKSSLGGNGLFAAGSINPGELLLCEKPFAITSQLDTTLSRGNLISPDTNGAVNNRKLALLQKLAVRSLADLASLESLLELSDGSTAEVNNENGSTMVFDSYHVLRIINCNAHTIFPGATSDQHDCFDPGNTRQPKHLPKPNEQRLGIWLKASLFNHSCVPNIHWAWIGDAIVARAVRPIKADEELTIAYMPGNFPYKNRKKGLQAYQIECTCPLCEADVAMKPSRESVDGLTATPKTRFGQPNTRTPEARKLLLRAIKPALRTYSPSSYFGEQPPAPGLANLFLQAAHDVLGPIACWATASTRKKEKAVEALHSCLTLGLSIEVSESYITQNCQLIRGPYAQVKAAGVIALIGLAELRFLEGNRERCAALKCCAKELYEICYGESASFGEKHGDYRSAAVQPSGASSNNAPLAGEQELVAGNAEDLLEYWKGK